MNPLPDPFDPTYLYGRDFNGADTPDTTPPRLAPQNDTKVGGWYNDDCLDTLIGKVHTWQLQSANTDAAIMFTELGTQTRHDSYQAPPFDGGGGSGYTGGDDNNEYRGRWMFDVRTALRSYGYGLSVWDYCGGFRIWDKNTTLWNPTDFHAAGNQGDLLPYPLLGLFGINRP